MRRGGIFWHGFAGLVLLFMLTPLFILVLFCFSENALLSFPIAGFTLDWFRKLFEHPQFWPSLRNSLIITLTVGVVSTVAGTMAALATARLRRSWSISLTLLVTLPVMLPPLMLGVALLSFFASIGMRLGLPTVIMSHLVFTQPFVVAIVAARMASFDHAAVESARDLGASRLRAFFNVTLPIIRPSVIGAALIAMALSLDDFVVTLFTIGGGSTLPIFMWGMLRKGVDPTINVIAVLLMLLSIGISLVGLRATRYRG
jgi:spermidine/putrescine transport system permease protein